MGARNRVGIVVLYQQLPACHASYAGGISSLESVSGLLKKFKNSGSGIESAGHIVHADILDFFLRS
jgi:hypothetical protein